MTTAQQRYQQQLRSPQWQKRRLAELNRTSFKCECCGAADHELQVHHLKYTSDHPASVPDGWLEVLCDDCHGWRESWNAVFGRTMQSTAMLRALVDNGLSALIANTHRWQRYDGGESIVGDLVTNVLRTLLGEFPAIDADAIVQSHLKELIQRRRPIERAARAEALAAEE